uniref:Uncharacterized protein n=1 Tax=Denticeps clupeoides TaxID=299321 RepID=A0AAY4B3M0_9TELE
MGLFYANFTCPCVSNYDALVFTLRFEESELSRNFLMLIEATRWITSLGRDSSGPSECCFDFYTKRIPVSRIQIALHGVLYFRTSCRFCANSASFWIYFRLKTVKDVDILFIFYYKIMRILSISCSQ